MSAVYTLGIDVGSTASKCIILKDGKEIVAKDNECSILRKTDVSKAYFNCHTDITIPYDEIGGIYSVHPDGTEVPIIEKGRFVLPGTEKLNEALDQAK